MENKTKKSPKKTGVKPTKIKPTDIKATEIKPTDIKATDIKATEIKSTDIQPTEIKATDIQSTEVKSENNKQEKYDNSKYSKSSAIIGFVGFIVASLLACIVWLTMGWQTYMFGFILASLGALVMFAQELKKMPITQEDVDEWNKKLHSSHQLKLEDFNSFFNKVSFWLHKLGKPIARITSSVALVGVVALWVITPVLYFSGVAGGSSAGGSSVAGNTYKDGSYTITFNTDNSYSQKYSGSTMDRGSWSQSGNKVTCKSNGGATIVFTVGSTYVQDTEGTRWYKT